MNFDMATRRANIESFQAKYDPVADRPDERSGWWARKVASLLDKILRKDHEGTDDGRRLLAQSFRLSDVFITVQGEGPRAGAPSLFIRLDKCNRTCTFCDTKFTWDRHAPDFGGVTLTNREQAIRFLQAVFGCLVQHPGLNLVITGGEPMLQGAFVETLILVSFLAQRRKKQLYGRSCRSVIEIETNGSIFMRGAQAVWASPNCYWSEAPQGIDVDVHFNVSPKSTGDGLDMAKALRDWYYDNLPHEGQTVYSAIIGGGHPMVSMETMPDGPTQPPPARILGHLTLKVPIGTRRQFTELLSMLEREAGLRGLIQHGVVPLYIMPETLEHRPDDTKPDADDVLVWDATVIQGLIERGIRVTSRLHNTLGVR